MSLINKTSLAATAENVNRRHLFGERITVAEAQAASTWIRGRYGISQRILDHIANAKKPNPEWAKIPRASC